MASVLPKAESLCYRNLLVVIKQTAFEEYSQVRSRRMYGGILKRDRVSCPPPYILTETLLLLIHFLVEITWTSSKGIAMETIGVSLQGS